MGKPLKRLLSNVAANPRLKPAVNEKSRSQEDSGTVGF
jgi:hypothetical protein